MHAIARINNTASRPFEIQSWMNFVLFYVPSTFVPSLSPHRMFSYNNFHACPPSISINISLILKSCDISLILCLRHLLHLPNDEEFNDSDNPGRDFLNYIKREYELARTRVLYSNIIVVWIEQNFVFLQIYYNVSS